MLETILQLNTISEGEYPPAEGWYYLAIKDVLDGTWRIENAYWVADKKCWQLVKNTGTLFSPAPYWGNIWMTNDIEKGFEKLWKIG